jgi:diguanylate cyclase (GGDEF)-like protein
MRTPSMTSMFIRTRANLVYYLTDMIFIIAITFSFFLLANDRALAEASEANAALEHGAAERERTEMALRQEMIERKALEEQLRELSVTDELTGVLNRRGVLHALQAEIQRADRMKSPLTMLLLDLDHFKQVNDRYGHIGGDRALIGFVAACGKNLRVVDTFGRLGGEEFAVVLPGTGLDSALVVAEKLRASVEREATQSGEQTILLTVSIGVAIWRADDSSGEHLLSQIDQAMYEAKEAGRNCVCVAEEQRPQTSFTLAFPDWPATSAELRRKDDLA